MPTRRTASTGLLVVGLVMLGYALAGNYIALPGYLRFLARGGTSAAGNAFDLAVIIGAAKTILWMYSFQLGVLCLALWHCQREGLRRAPFVIGGVLWLSLWSWPTLPAPGAWFYAIFGSALLVLIASVFAGPARWSNESRGASLRLGSIAFFAFATWEVCGLGSTGRMLHPEEAAQPIAHNLLITQSSKLMLEFVLAWGLLAGAALARTSASERVSK